MMWKEGQCRGMKTADTMFLLPWKTGQDDRHCTPQIAWRTEFPFFSLSTLCPLPEPSHFSKNGKLLKCYLVEISSSFFLNLRRSAFILNVFFSEKFLFECRRWRFLVGRSEVISIIPTVSSQFEHCVRGRDTSDGLFDSRSKIVSELFCKSGILN